MVPRSEYPFPQLPPLDLAYEPRGVPLPEPWVGDATPARMASTALTWAGGIAIAFGLIALAVATGADDAALAPVVAELKRSAAGDPQFQANVTPEMLRKMYGGFAFGLSLVGAATIVVARLARRGARRWCGVGLAIAALGAAGVGLLSLVGIAQGSPVVLVFLPPLMLCVRAALGFRQALRASPRG